MKLIKTKKPTVKVKDDACLNCGHPFNGQEKFCPDCGQKNQGKKITFSSFIYDVFNGLFSFDAKFWNTLIPLLIKPGSVSANYKAGKRNRYSNPFRFYITVSILFFLTLSLADNYTKYKTLFSTELQVENKQIEDLIKDNTIPTDSILKLVETELDNSIISPSKKEKTKILNRINKQLKDSVQRQNIQRNNISFAGTRLDTFYKFQKKYPSLETDKALDSLNFNKNFKNRLLYAKTNLIQNIINNTSSREQFLKEVLSYGSVSLFIFLPLFTLFLKLFYIRRTYTYIDHLIFVFHTQTVFFMLLTIVAFLGIFINLEDTSIVLLLFLVYLFIAMRKFYKQSYFKTFIKFCLLNFVYLLIGSIGAIFVTLLAFAIY